MKGDREGQTESRKQRTEERKGRARGGEEAKSGALLSPPWSCPRRPLFFFFFSSNASCRRGSREAFLCRDLH